MLVDAHCYLLSDACERLIRLAHGRRLTHWQRRVLQNAKKKLPPPLCRSLFSLRWLCGTTGVADIRKHKTATLCACLFGREMTTFRRHFRSSTLMAISGRIIISESIDFNQLHFEQCLKLIDLTPSTACHLLCDSASSISFDGSSDWLHFFSIINRPVVN